MREELRIGILLLLLVFLIAGKAQAQQVSSDLVYGVSEFHRPSQFQPHHVTPLLLIPEGFGRIRQKADRVNPAQIGQKEAFFVRNIMTLNTWYSLEAECLYTSNYLSVWIHSDLKISIQDSIRLDDILPELIRFLEHETPALSIDSGIGSIPILHQWFGLPPDINGEGTVDILLLDIPDLFDAPLIRYHSGNYTNYISRNHEQIKTTPLLHRRVQDQSGA